MYKLEGLSFCPLVFAYTVTVLFVCVGFFFLQGVDYRRNWPIMKVSSEQHFSTLENTMADLKQLLAEAKEELDKQITDREAKIEALQEEIEQLKDDFMGTFEDFMPSSPRKRKGGPTHRETAIAIIHEQGGTISSSVFNAMMSKKTGSSNPATILSQLKREGLAINPEPGVWTLVGTIDDAIDEAVEESDSEKANSTVRVSEMKTDDEEESMEE